MSKNDGFKTIDLNTIRQAQAQATAKAAYLIIYAVDGIGVAADILPDEPAPVYVIGKGFPHSVLALRGPTFEAARDQLRKLISDAVTSEARPLAYRQ
jgi:hypothetical protein